MRATIQALTLSLTLVGHAHAQTLEIGDQIEVQLKEANLTWVTEKLKGGLYFDIGEVDTPANREDLEYTDRTKTTILDKLQLATDSDEPVESPSDSHEPWLTVSVV